MPDYVIHIGVHKTASSLLQKNLLANLEGLRRQGFWFLSGENDWLKRAHLRCLRKMQRGTYDEATEGRFQQLSANLKRSARQSGAHTVLMSEENYIGIPLHRQMTWFGGQARFYPNAADCLKHLTTDLPPKRMRFVLYQRDAADLLRGHYMEGLRVLRFKHSFKEFLDRVDIASFRFDQLLERLRAAVPDAEFVVKPFEPIKSNPDRFIRDFLVTCGVDPTEFVIDPSVERSSVDARQAEQLRQMAQACDTVPSRRLRLRAAKVFDTASDKTNPVVIPPEYHDRLALLSQVDAVSDDLVSALNGSKTDRHTG